MAVFKIVKENYIGEEDLGNLIGYVCRKSSIVVTQGLCHTEYDLYKNQFLYLQHCSGKQMYTRARHWILSFDTAEWECGIGVRELYTFACCCMTEYVKGYQCIIGIHDNPKNRHIHMLINPVRLNDYKIFHLSPNDLKNLMWQMAQDLFMWFGIALQNVSYIDAEGRMRKTDKARFLYENRGSMDIPLIDTAGKVSVCPYPFFILPPEVSVNQIGSCCF